MASWRKRPKATEIDVTEQHGELPVIEIELTEQQTLGLDFLHKRKHLGLLHPETLHAAHMLAIVAGRNPTDRDGAIELLEWLVDARADDQENRLLTLNDLTRLLEDSGRPAHAERWLREALSGWERLRGQDDPMTLQIAANLAQVLIELGRHEEAEGLMRDTVARRTRTLGATHPDTLESKNTLAGTLRGSPARAAEAARIYRAIMAAADGATELALVARNNLAAVLARQGEHTEALKLYRDLVDAHSQRHGDDHEITLHARHNHAVVLNSLGHVTEAEALLGQLLEEYRRTYGARHTDTLGVQVDLAATIANQGRNAEAVPLLRDAIEGYRSTHGPEHPLVRELTGILAELI